jgi:hypothetical protein
LLVEDALFLGRVELGFGGGSAFEVLVLELYLLFLHNNFI